MATIEGVLERPLTAEAIVDSLPEPDYLKHRQPEYPQRYFLEGAVTKLLAMEGVATKEDITTLQEEFTRIADNEVDETIIILGRCSQPVKLETDIDELVTHEIQALDICNEGLRGNVRPKVIARKPSGKPRSAAKQIRADGSKVTPHMGDEINGESILDRTPDPSRMVSAAIQDRDIRAGLIAAGKEIPAAKEVLLLPSLKAMMRTDPVTGKKYYVGAELPWIGERTRQPDGDHIEALIGIENPIGIKLGPTTTADEIRQYQEKLNPDGVHGKLVFMLRMGLEHTGVLEQTIDAIKEHAPHALLMYDIHGSTTTDEQGRKIRSISRIIEEIHTTAKVCTNAGTRLHGIHLETTMERHPDGSERLECVDYDGQAPKDEGGIDPQANERQTKYLIGAVASALALTV